MSSDSNLRFILFRLIYRRASKWSFKVHTRHKLNRHRPRCAWA